MIHPRNQRTPGMTSPGHVHVIWSVSLVSLAKYIETLKASVYTSTCHLHPSNIASLQPEVFLSWTCFPYGSLICLLFWKERNGTQHTAELSVHQLFVAFKCCSILLFRVLVGSSSSHAATIALDARSCTTASPSCGNQQSMAAAVGLLAMCTVQMLVRFGSFVSHVDEYTNWQWAFQWGVQR